MVKEEAVTEMPYLNPDTAMVREKWEVRGWKGQPGPFPDSFVDQVSEEHEPRARCGPGAGKSPDEQNGQGPWPPSTHSL